MTRAYTLYCDEDDCDESAVVEVWFSHNVADYLHFCERHWATTAVRELEDITVYHLRH